MSVEPGIVDSNVLVYALDAGQPYCRFAPQSDAPGMAAILLGKL